MLGFTMDECGLEAAKNQGILLGPGVIILSLMALLSSVVENLHTMRTTVCRSLSMSTAQDAWMTCSVMWGSHLSVQSSSINLERPMSPEQTVVNVPLGYQSAFSTFASVSARLL
ncbi:hypothetical protein CHARACLAT_019904 [Characodon lateralis]|uniref:Uncharacterized protein n=1 Tax=Characodon lateralis TaxID=208331 RepID=A0ABU7F5H6_9TELE|nr:hypothetical protein [Characodon lateralis]